MHDRFVSALMGMCLVSFLLAYADATTILSGTVVAIADGDSMTVLVDRTQHKVRLYGIDGPERQQLYGTVARQALADRIVQKDVTVIVGEKDRYGRWIGLVILTDGQMANDLQVQQGVCWYYEYVAKHDVVLSTLQADAQGGEAGVMGRSEPRAAVGVSEGETRHMVMDTVEEPYAQEYPYSLSRQLLRWLWGCVGGLAEVSG